MVNLRSWIAKLWARFQLREQMDKLWGRFINFCNKTFHMLLILCFA